MFSRFLALFNGGMRAYKVQDAKRETRIGVTAKTLADLKKKGCEKLQLDPDEVTVVIEDDGTLVEDETFFKKLPAQTVFVFLREGERWRGAGSMIHEALSKLYTSSRRKELAGQIRDLLQDDTAPEKMYVMSTYLDMLDTKVDAENRHEHEDWFEGVNKKFKTKSDVMKNSAQQRIRSYYSAAKDQIEREGDSHSAAMLDDLMEEVSDLVKVQDFHGAYFDRTAPPAGRLCDTKGWFHCEGPFDMEACDKKHSINPYASREHRLMFGLWNLDHIIEKSREVIPTLLLAAKKKPKNMDLDPERVYQLLFSKRNLKLVHVGCHKKAARTQSPNLKWQDFCVS